MPDTEPHCKANPTVLVFPGGWMMKRGDAGKWDICEPGGDVVPDADPLRFWGSIVASFATQSDKVRMLTDAGEEMATALGNKVATPMTVKSLNGWKEAKKVVWTDAKQG